MALDPQWVTFLEIILAMFLGGLIGYEREVAEKPAGLRTHILVAGAATLFVALGETVIAQYLALFSADAVRADPVRIFEAIIVGISFLGAGTIFRRKEGENVEGLTTAASILLTAGLGIAVALRQFLLAISVTVLVLLVMRLLGWIENRILNKRKRY
jgi:putative Mg2+ transporter-C (MgtC) family protein